MKTKKISLFNANGQKIAALIDFPLLKKPKAYALFAHWFTCRKNLNAVTNISRGLTDRGFAVLRFDFTGLGESEGDFADTNFSTNINDLIAACKFLGAEYKSPQLLIGHSLGGAAVLHAASELSNVEAIATIGSPAEPLHVTHLFADQKEMLQAEGEADVNIGGRPFKIKEQFIKDIEKQNTQDLAQKLRGKSIRITHSPQDEIVGVENARQIYEQMHHPKSYVSLDGANHLLTAKKDAIYVGHIISS